MASPWAAGQQNQQMAQQPRLAQAAARPQAAGPPPPPTAMFAPQQAAPRQAQAAPRQASMASQAASYGGDSYDDSYDYQPPPFAQPPQQQVPPPPPPPPPQVEQQQYTPPADQRIVAPEIYDPGDIGRSGYAKGTGPTRDWYGQDYTTGQTPESVGMPPRPPEPVGPSSSPTHHAMNVKMHQWIYEGIRRGLTLADMGFQPAVGAGLALYKHFGENSGALLQQLAAEGPQGAGAPGGPAPGGPGGPGAGGPPNTSVIPNQPTPGGNAPGGGGNQVAPVFGGDSNNLIAQLLPFLLGSQGSPIRPGGYGSGILADTYAPEYGLYGTQGNLMMQMMQMMAHGQQGAPGFTRAGTITTGSGTGGGLPPGVNRIFPGEETGEPTMSTPSSYYRPQV